ncbi:unnamed protein product [Schistocephalus solidus]|uniref:Reverse transcriptase domain-containing protein n=1 Tax=Schistocephalus solidus TaxID=70667 RepID=A0A183SWJ6_SCHSO|nr:unnamed protein product [Schistocephalus solidus]
MLFRVEAVFEELKSLKACKSPGPNEIPAKLLLELAQELASNRPERRMALGTRELARYKVDIATLSETLFSEQGQLEEVGAGFTFFWSGQPKAERCDAGVAFAIRNDIVGCLPCLPQVTGGVNQGCVLAPTLFSLMFSAMLMDAYCDEQPGIRIAYRTDGTFSTFGVCRLQRACLRLQSMTCSSRTTAPLTP